MADSHPLPPRLIAILQDMPLEELAFVAVPVRARRDGWTKVRQQGFILRLALGGCVTLAAKGVGMTNASAYRLRRRPGAESFAAAWDRAQGWGQDRTIDVGLERALCGEQVPVVRAGRCIATLQRYDNRLAMTVLNALDRRAAARPLAPAVEEALFRLFDPPAPRTENKGSSPPT